MIWQKIFQVVALYVLVKMFCFILFHVWVFVSRDLTLCFCEKNMFSQVIFVFFICYVERSSFQKTLLETNFEKYFFSLPKK